MTLFTFMFEVKYKCKKEVKALFLFFATTNPFIHPPGQTMTYNKLSNTVNYNATSPYPNYKWLMNQTPTTSCKKPDSTYY